MERITQEDLKRRLDAHERLTLIDVRAPNAWKASEVRLPDAVRVPPNEVDADIREKLETAEAEEEPGEA